MFLIIALTVNMTVASLAEFGQYIRLEKGPIRVRRSGDDLNELKSCFLLCKVHNCEYWAYDKLRMECHVKEDNRKLVVKVLQTLSQTFRDEKEVREKLSDEQWVIGYYNNRRQWYENILLLASGNTYNSLRRNLREKFASRALRRYLIDSWDTNQHSVELSTSPLIGESGHSTMVSQPQLCQLQCDLMADCKWYYFCRENKNDLDGHCILMKTDPHSIFGARKSFPGRGNRQCAEFDYNSV